MDRFIRTSRTHFDAKGRQTKRCARKMSGSRVSPQKIVPVHNQMFANDCIKPLTVTVSHVNQAFGHFATIETTQRKIWVIPVILEGLRSWIIDALRGGLHSMQPAIHYFSIHLSMEW